MAELPPEVKQTLVSLHDAVREDFTRNRRVLSFAEYLTLVFSEPTRQLRSSTQYIVDCFDHYGTENVKYPWGDVRRWKLFDAPWANGEDRLFGQEYVQAQVYRVLRSFVQDGRPNKLILLHGPNGSAKSTFIRCLGRALEHYSTLEEGALYRFSWIFPSQKSTKGGIGFGGASAIESLESFAYLPDDQTDARLPDELHDHPLLLVPLDERQKLIDKLTRPGFNVSDYLRTGSLSPKNRAVYDALLASYMGDYVQVLRHVRVERFEISHRYRNSWVTVEPQLSVDATERQVTADRTLGALPPSLQSVSRCRRLHESHDQRRASTTFSPRGHRSVSSAPPTGFATQSSGCGRTGVPSVSPNRVIGTHGKSTNLGAATTSPTSRDTAIRRRPASRT